jgi:hypothetical protein
LFEIFVLFIGVVDLLALALALALALELLRR